MLGKVVPIGFGAFLTIILFPFRFVSVQHEITPAQHEFLGVQHEFLGVQHEVPCLAAWDNNQLLVSVVVETAKLFGRARSARPNSLAVETTSETQQMCCSLNKFEA